MAAMTNYIIFVYRVFDAVINTSNRFHSLVFVRWVDNLC